MIRYGLSLQARRDLANIYSFSKQRWGEAQADKYISEMFNLFQKIGDKKARSRPLTRYDLDGQYSVHGSHFIYWRRITSGDAVIVTILHQHMVQADRVRIAFSKSP